jgi:hypothetical protein
MAGVRIRPIREAEGRAAQPRVDGRGAVGARRSARDGALSARDWRGEGAEVTKRHTASAGKRRRWARRDAQKKGSSRDATGQTLNDAATRFDHEADRFLSRVPRPIGDDNRAIAIALARRGIFLWRAHRHSIKGPSLAASRIVLRTLAELQVTVGWLWLRPDVHLQLWRAESARHLGTIYREMPLTFAGQVIDSSAVATAILAQTDDAVNAARQLLKDLKQRGQPVEGIAGPSLIPSTEKMALQLTKAHKGSFADVYRLSVRSGGDWVHSAYTTLIRARQDADTIYDNETLSDQDMARDRLEAVGAVVALAWLVSDIADLGLATDCQRFFMEYYNVTMAHVDDFRQSMLEGFQQF